MITLPHAITRAMFLAAWAHVRGDAIIFSRSDAQRGCGTLMLPSDHNDRDLDAAWLRERRLVIEALGFAIPIRVVPRDSRRIDRELITRVSWPHQRNATRVNTTATWPS